MIEIILKLFIKNCGDYTSPKVRKYCGIICSSWGMILNLLLCLLKFIAGSVSGSVAVTVDAVHNLTDSASSAVTLLSFILSGQKKTEKFPMGKGRTEYVAGFFISMVLLTAGAQLAVSSAEKIISPEPVTFSALSVILLIISVLTKLYMASYGLHYGKKIASAALRASATDCLCDCFATLIAVFSLICVKFTDLNVDAWGGLAVSLFILYAGLKAAKDTVKLLIGSAPDKKLLREIDGLILQFPEIRNTGNIILHDYGPENRILCIEICFSEDVLLSRAEEIAEKLKDAICCDGCKIEIIYFFK